MTDPTIEPPPSFSSPPAPPPERHWRRSRTHRVVGGVAGGIAERFDIDVTVVRVIFAVLAVLWGLGVALYLVLWVVTPSDDGTADVEERPSGGGGAIWLVALAAAASLLTVALSLAGDLPSLGGAVGVLWLAAGVVVLALALRHRSGRATLSRALGGLVLFFLVIAVLIGGALSAFLASTGVPLSGGTGARTAEPLALSELASPYRLAFGALTVNLNDLSFPGDGRNENVTASVGVGKLTVDIPANVVVDLQTRVGIGGVSLNTWQGANEYESFSDYPSGVAHAVSARRDPHLTLSVQIGIGQIWIVRGGPTISYQGA